MGYDGTMIIATLVIIAIALFIGWLVAFNNAERPTLGDVLIGTAMSSGFPAVIIIVLLWKFVH